MCPPAVTEEPISHDAHEVGAVVDTSHGSPSVPIFNKKMNYWVLVVSHLLVDIYPFFVFSLAATLVASLRLNETQITTVQAVSPIISGLVQPLFAWLGDKHDTRFFGAFGLALGAVCIGSMGFATEYWHLLVLQFVGSAVAGSLGANAMRNVRFVRSARGLGLSIFFTAGMLGGFTGPILASRVNSSLGLGWLWILIIPGVVGAAMLWLATRHIPHKPTISHTDDEPSPVDDIPLRTRWYAISLLFVSNSLRFTVNVGLYKLYTLWASERYAGLGETLIDSRGSDVLSATTIGMAITGLCMGSFIRPGSEKWPIFLTGFLTIPVLLLMPHVGYWAMLALAVTSAVGHFSVVPLSIACAQRLLPHATGMVGSILMGCGWVVSAIGPFLVIAIYERFDNGLDLGFYTLAVLLALSGVCGILLPSRVIKTTKDVH
ncbi:MAG: MFS transporter [Planctomycetota bacterium]|jgi:FSR family fosmidomycin resistance protein-like MFS transporter